MVQVGCMHQCDKVALKIGIIFSVILCYLLCGDLVSDWLMNLKESLFIGFRS
jgi:hypothetical protein